MMLRHVLCSLSLTLVMVNAHAADKAREVSWEDLLPPSVRQIHEQAETINRELSALHGAEREAFEQVRDERDLRQRIDRGFIREADLDDKNRAMLADPPSRRHPKALAFWERVEALSGALRAERLKPNPSLSGAAVRLPGYVLPLEFEGELVREFLLVPYVGACIHSPPPPANQMVFVRAEKSFKTAGLFEPVWVQGVIKADHGNHKLTLVDGSDDVEAGYSMADARIEAYRAR